MADKQFSWDVFNRMPLVGIMRNFSQPDIENILPAYADSGLNTIEVTMNSAGAVESIEHIAKNFSGSLNVGAGTVLTKEELDVALQAGAQFIVTPVVPPTEGAGIRRRLYAYRNSCSMERWCRYGESFSDGRRGT
jgi:2-dehydro-3-deoxyphosphogluconate aldolase/(4S)-4-hydroxy-2-oxoglutarate aldolase